MGDEDLNIETIVLGGGCFWCTEAIFKMLKGVVFVEPGYAGGEEESAIYEEVSTGTTGHAEVVKIMYDPKVITFEKILTVFFATHDSTTLNKQGKDIGSQYRSIIFYTTKDQEKEAKKFIEEINLSSTKGKLIVTHVQPLKTFYKAENHHKDYYLLHPEETYCQLVINPKLKKVKEKFTQLLKPQ